MPVTLEQVVADLHVKPKYPLADVHAEAKRVREKLELFVKNDKECGFIEPVVAVEVRGEFAKLKIDATPKES
jgi:hypothetical protein